MTTLSGRPGTALLVIDTQVKVMAGTHNRDGVIANIAALVERARAAKVPVIWIQHSDDELAMGSDGWQYVPEPQQEDSEPIVHKHYGDAFEDSELESALADRQVGRVVITGAQTDMRIRGTLHGAFTRGYDATLVTDATRPRTCARGASPSAPSRSSRTPTPTGAELRPPGARATPSRRRRSTSRRGWTE